MDEKDTNGNKMYKDLIKQLSWWANWLIRFEAFRIVKAKSNMWVL